MAAGKGKRRRQFLPHNRPAMKKGAYPLRPGIQGFFITCDGGRERQASHEAIYILDTYYEELVHGKSSDTKFAGVPNTPLNKKIVFESSSDEEDINDNDDGEEQEAVEREEEKKEVAEDEKGERTLSDTCDDNDESQICTTMNSDPHYSEKVCSGKELKALAGENDKDDKHHEGQANETEEPPAKKQRLEADASKCVITENLEEESIDKQIEAELREIGDKNKRRFINLDSGCNGVAVVQMRRTDGEPSPGDVVQHVMTSVASTRKPMSRSILRVLPIEVACYASEEEISRAIKPLVTQYFPEESQNPQKFAVLYEARANTGIDRMKIINAVAKSVPAPHKVDLSNPHKTIVVEIVKTVCMIGVVDKYKELAKYNVRQLTTPKQ